MKPINYIKGDATNPIGNGNKIIIHCCNDVGAWGAGFVLALSRRFPTVEYAYRYWFKEIDDELIDTTIYSKTGPCVLGEVQFCKVNNNIWVANMIGQHNIGFINNLPPIRYDAIETCLNKVAKNAKDINASIHCPRFGSGLAGGNWLEIEKLINKTLILNNISVTVYAF